MISCRAILPRIRSVLCIAVGAFAATLATSAAWADPVNIVIDDLSDTPTLTLTGAVQNQSNQTSPEGIGALATADSNFEFISTDPNRPVPGQVLVTNYDMFDPNSSVISDTLNITITGHTPGFLGDSNESIDLHFRSDSLDNIAPPALFSPINITETGGFQSVFTGLTDFILQFRSEVPEPATLGLIGVGLLGLGLARRRKGA